MKTVTKYEANDGKLFDYQIDASAHDDYLKQVDVVAAMLPPRPDDGCKFESGGGYLQHAAETVREFKRSVLLLAANNRPDSKFVEWAKNPDEVHGISIIGRYIDDGCDRYIGRLWHRVCCMDSQCREWGQPYFALNPEKAERFQIAA